jgi:hypothetical protein
MTALVLVRWVASRWIRQPWKWAIVSSLIALWPALQALTPFGVASGTARLGALYEIAFVAAVAGSACALDALDVLPSCARALGIASSWSAEWFAVALASLAVQASALALPIAASELATTELNELVACACLHAAWLGGVAVVALRVRMPNGMRPIVFLIATWVLPALAPNAAWSRTLGATIEPPNHEVAFATFIATRVATVSALLLGVHLVDAHRARRP